MPTKENKNTLNIALALLVIVLLLSVAGNFLLYKKVEGYKEDPQRQAEEAVADLVAEVSKYIVLPEGEQPTVATVTDPEKLKEQAFFTKASVGDKVLIYTNAKKAILYSPTQHKIIEVAPINIGEPQQEEAVAPGQSGVEVSVDTESEAASDAVLAE